MPTTLLSVLCFIPAVWLVYTLRAWWLARRDWQRLSSDTKAFYLLVAPPITLAFDLFLLLDKMFYSPSLARGSRGGGTLMMKLVAFLISLLILPHNGHAADHDCMHERPAAVDKGDEPALGRMRQPYLTPAEASALQYRDRESETIEVDISAERAE